MHPQKLLEAEEELANLHPSLGAFSRGLGGSATPAQLATGQVVKKREERAVAHLWWATLWVDPLVCNGTGDYCLSEGGKLNTGLGSSQNTWECVNVAEWLRLTAEGGSMGTGAAGVEPRTSQLGPLQPGLVSCQVSSGSRL